jgi:ribosomal-protein-alanine N-acetyltransferase
MNSDRTSHLFGIFEKDGNGHVGNIKLGFIKERHASGQLSLVIGEKSCWGKGYATEAIRAVTVWAFDELGLERVEAGCYDQNTGSLRAFLKVGYSVEGYHRRSVVLDGARTGSFWLGILKGEVVG